MENKQSMVVLINYECKNKAIIEKSVESFISLLQTDETKVKKIYQGDDKRVISALESIMDLTK